MNNRSFHGRRLGTSNRSVEHRVETHLPVLPRQEQYGRNFPPVLENRNTTYNHERSCVQHTSCPCVLILLGQRVLPRERAER